MLVICDMSEASVFRDRVAHGKRGPIRRTERGTSFRRLLCSAWFTAIYVYRGGIAKSPTDWNLDSKADSKFKRSCS